MRQHLGPGAHTRAWISHEACRGESQPTPRRWSTSSCPGVLGARSVRQELLLPTSAPEAPHVGRDGRSSLEGLHPEQSTAGLREGGPHTKRAWAPNPVEGLIPSEGQQTAAAEVLKEARCWGQGEPEPRKRSFRQHLQVGRAEPARRHHLSWGRQRLQRRASTPGWVLTPQDGSVLTGTESLGCGGTMPPSTLRTPTASESLYLRSAGKA